MGKKRFAVFADRDGVINKEVGNLWRIEDLEIIPKVSQAIKILNEYDIPFIVITNQPVVARGWITENGVREINNKIQDILRGEGAQISDFYFCPHHPNANLKKYRVSCNCRKPEIGLFREAANKYHIDLKKSYVIGDSFRDIEAGKRLGATTIAVQTGTSDFRDSTPNYNMADLYEAVKFILKKEGLV